jgi:hypothetical protein
MMSLVGWMLLTYATMTGFLFVLLGNLAEVAKLSAKATSGSGTGSPSKFYMSSS